MPDQPELRQRLAEAIFQHSVCDCGEYADDFNEQCMHVAGRLLALPGIAITTLPERATNSNGYDWKADGDSVYCDVFDNRRISAVVLESDAGEAQLIYPQNPRALAAALLAAAGVAEEQTNA